MSEEEKEAIEELKNWIKIVENNKDKIKQADLMVNIQETILNLIQKQQKDIEKKDKIIDEMALTIEKLLKNVDFEKEFITYKEQNKEEIKQYFERKAESEDK